LNQTIITDKYPDFRRRISKYWFALLLFSLCIVQSVTIAAPISLDSTWTDTSNGGQIFVKSIVSNNTYIYEVTNISWNPPGGDNYYGITSFNPRAYNDSFIPQIISYTSPIGWDAFANLLGYPFINWNSQAAGLDIDQNNPNRPIHGLLPGNSAVFSFSVAEGEPVTQTGLVASYWSMPGSSCFGCYSLMGELLYPGHVTSPIPEPNALVLMCSGFALLGWMRRRLLLNVLREII